MPGIPSKDASFVWGTPRNYALTKEGWASNDARMKASSGGAASARMEAMLQRVNILVRQVLPQLSVFILGIIQQL